MKATHKEHSMVVGCQKVHLLPGEFIFGRKSASEELGISEQSIRTIVDFLKESGNLTSKTTNKFSVISINNWDTYQSQEDVTNQQINKPLTSNQPATNHKQEHKNVNNEKKKEYTPEFLSFWNLYPNRNGKADAYKCWNKLNGTRPPIEVILSAIQNQIDWRENAGKDEFRPAWKNPSTWLNKGCWEDETEGKEGNIDAWVKSKQQKVEKKSWN